MSSSYLGDNCFLSGRRVLNRGVGELNSNHLDSIRMGFGNSWTKTENYDLCVLAQVT